MRVFRVLWPLISLPMMLSFCYIYNATRSFGSTMWRSVAKCGATFVAVITAVIFRQYLHSLGSMLLPMVLYPLVLSFMTAMAGTLPFAVSTQWILFALGAAAFCISDLFVARDFICGITGTQKNGALILYYLAVYAMASIQLYL